MINRVLLTLAIVYSLQGLAKDYNHTVQGRVFDSMTGLGLDSVDVILMNVDSVELARTISWQKAYGAKFVGRYSLSIQKRGKYIIKATRKGYDDAYIDFELRSNRETTILPKAIRLTRKSTVLPEVTIKASKIKMVMEGDTIVYNADAFNLPQGSMLDALVSKLPGVRLTKDGQIYVNGNYVQSLLVNGRDFFSGNPKIALENLPSYTVNKVKVYNKSGSISRMMGKPMGDETYVMDVRLKKEYSSGYMANAEAGAGTGKRYLGKLLGMKFTEIERLYIFGNADNLNNNKIEGLSDSWVPVEQQSGLTATHAAGMSYSRDMGNGGNFMVESIYGHTNVDDRSLTSSETYLPNGNSWIHHQISNIAKNTSWATNVTYKQEKKLVGYYSTSIKTNFKNNDNHVNTFQTISDQSGLLNQLIGESKRTGKDFSINFNHDGGKRLVADYLRWTLSAEYDRMTSDLFSIQDTRYTNMSHNRDFRHNYLDQANQNWKLNAHLNYAINWPDKSIIFNYDYQYLYNKTGNMLYRLDKLYSSDSTNIGWLPSVDEYLFEILDRNNSYQYREYHNTHKAGLVLKIELCGGAQSEFSFPLRLAHRKLYYERLGRHDVRKNHLFFEPAMHLDLTLKPIRLKIDAAILSEIPELTAMVDYQDDSDPLCIISGNSSLKNTHIYSARMTVSQYNNNFPLSGFLGWTQTDNAVAYSIDFNKNNGVSKIKPVNVNGNWTAYARLDYQLALDKARKWTIDGNIDVDYNHNVDMATTGSYTGSMKSIVNYWRPSTTLSLNWRPNDKYEFTLHGKCSGYIISGERNGFDNTNAIDFNAGVNTTLNLPWGIQMTTDMTMFARRGWKMSEMNTTDWVWNAQISRSFFKGKLLAKLKGFDILHQLSNIKYAVNAQGRTETWHNSIPRYAMLSLAWRFNVNPRKK